MSVKSDLREWLLSRRGMDDPDLRPRLIEMAERLKDDRPEKERAAPVKERP